MPEWQKVLIFEFENAVIPLAMHQFSIWAFKNE